MIRDSARRVLIMDPDPLFSSKLNAVLSSRGYEVETAGCLATAVERLRDVDFDCVIMDEALPEIKGYDAVPILEAFFPDIPIIMTATKNTPALESRIRCQRVFFYYVKSFEIGEIQMAVDDAFRSMGRGIAAPGRR